jgi:hypothetical protein
VLTDIETAFGQRLNTMAGVLPVVWPNKTSEPAKPYFSVQHVPTSNESPALSGGGEVQRGYFIVTVVTASNSFSTSANTNAEAIKARFPKGLTLSAGSRKMRIWRPAQMLPGFADDADWRQPVRVDYLVTGK